MHVSGAPPTARTAFRLRMLPLYDTRTLKYNTLACARILQKYNSLHTLRILELWWQPAPGTPAATRPSSQITLDRLVTRLF